jgi:hypothetical protein
MSFFSRVKAFIKQEPEEQIAGYSVAQLKAIFTTSSIIMNRRLPEYPKAVSLEGLGIPAFYISFLIDTKGTPVFFSAHHIKLHIQI